MEIPFLDLVTPHVELEDELVSVVRSALRSGQFIGGAEVDSFEKEFAAFCETSHAVTVSSGTDALWLALKGAGVGKGDLVLTVPNTFIGTTEAVTRCGADFDFVDIDEQTFTMDPNKLRQYIDSHRGINIKAILPVHLYGQMADMDPILELARKHRMVVIEDACQAHGARYFSRKHERWFRAGSMGDAAGFSFYPGKNLGGCGEGGAVTTNNPEIAKTVRMFRDHGQSQKYYHQMEGHNCRLDAIQCGFLRAKLRRIDEWNQIRRNAAANYSELLNGIPGITLPFVPSWSEPVYHLYVVRASLREDLQKHLNERKISTGLHYPVPLHLQKCYAHRQWKETDFPIATKMAISILSLPMFPQLRFEQQARIASEIKSFYHAQAAGAVQVTGADDQVA